MRALAVALLVFGSATAGANERFLAEETLPAKRVTAELAPRLDDAVWKSIHGTVVAAHPQRSIRLTDASVNGALEKRTPIPVTVKAAHNTRDLALWMQWSDDSEDRVNPDETSAFADSVAVQFPVRFGAGLRLPYIGMGDEESPVYVYMQRATGKGADLRQHVAAGFGSLTRADIGGARVAMAYDKSTRQWRALFIRPLDAAGQSLKQGWVPFALATWDGAHHDRGGNKTLSRWKFLRLEGIAASEKYQAEQSVGYADADRGDAAKGKILVESVCIACHWVGDKKLAPAGLAPDLSGVGGIASYGYLRDSVTDPSKVIVPPVNVNRHYARAATPDAFGAYPNNDAFRWFTVDGNGRKVSKMPPFGQLPPDDVRAIVAYLKTLEQ